MKNLRATVVAATTVVMSIPVAPAATDKQIDDLTSYAVIIGRGLACGEDIEDPMNRVGAWLLNSFAPKERGPYLRVLVTGIEYHAGQQRDGLSPDTCAAARRAFQRTHWPQ